MFNRMDLYAVKSNKLRTCFIDDFIQLYCLRHVSKKPFVHPQDDLYKHVENNLIGLISLMKNVWILLVLTTHVCHSVKKR
jgi:hypothetical protein